MEPKPANEMADAIRTHLARIERIRRELKERARQIEDKINELEKAKFVSRETLGSEFVI